MLHQTTVQRLAFIKYLYMTAVRQSEQRGPLASASILMFHDSVELFLQLASERLNVGKSDLGFMDYWDVLSPKLPGEGLTQKESMRRLNRARVSLKHHGIMPSRLDIEGFRASATNFFGENTPQIFGVDFASVSMVDLVRCAETRESLRKAQQSQEQGNLEEALDLVAVAFSQLIDDYECRKRSTFGRTPFSFGEALDFELFKARGSIGSNVLSFLDKVTESIESIAHAIKILGLGIDYRQYSRFRQLTPGIMKTPGGTWHITHWRGEGDPPLTVEDYKFCYDFVIESAIRLQEFDFEVE